MLRSHLLRCLRYGNGRTGIATNHQMEDIAVNYHASLIWGGGSNNAATGGSSGSAAGGDAANYSRCCNRRPWVRRADSNRREIDLNTVIQPWYEAAAAPKLSGNRVLFCVE